MSLTFQTARGRTNFDLRKTLGGAETPTSPNGNSTFRSRSGSGTYGYKSRQNDTGYASSISSGLFIYHSNQMIVSRYPWKPVAMVTADIFFMTYNQNYIS